jgi:signal transduction histidine kinase/CheY-like chemotaxis protein
MSEKKPFFKDRLTIISIIIGVVIFIAAFAYSTKKEERDAKEMINETLDFLNLQCIRYDNIMASNEMKDHAQLIGKVMELKNWLEAAENPMDEEFLKDYAKRQDVGGIIILSNDGELFADGCIDGKSFEDWRDVLDDRNILDVVNKPQKVYISHKSFGVDDGYDFVAMDMPNEDALIFAYSPQLKQSDGVNELRLDNLLEGYRLDLGAMIFVTDGEEILSSNDEKLINQQISEYSLIDDHINEISSSEVSVIHEENKGYMAMCMKTKDYYLYIFLPNSEVYRQRYTVMAYVLIFYVFYLVVFTLVRQREANHSNMLKMDFLRQMSHDIRTPINGIRGMVRIGKSYPDDMEKQKECLEKIWEASDILMELVNDVLDMGKLESGEIKLERKAFNIKELIESAAMALENQADSFKVKLIIGDTCGEHLDLIGSPVHIRRILINLVSNAVKYNRENGTVKVSCRELEKKGADNRAWFEIVCEDTGIGMSKEFQKQMFSKFTQENSAGEVSHHGTGLGLPIVKGLVTEMNGKITCKSEKGVGTTFYITLPFEISDTPVTKEDNTEKFKDTLDDTSILLVEDNELNMEIAEFVLNEAGARITKAWNGKEAVEIFERSKPGELEVILMDMMMPIMDGEAAARAIRSLDREDAKTVPIIAMTANAFEEDEKKSRDAGMNAHFAKPIDAGKLVSLINSLKKN